MADQPELDFEFYLPAGRETFRVWEVAKILHHSKQQVMALIEEGSLGAVVDCRSRRSSRASYVITRAALLQFLRERKR